MKCCSWRADCYFRNLPDVMVRDNDSVTTTTQMGSLLPAWSEWTILPCIRGRLERTGGQSRQSLGKGNNEYVGAKLIGQSCSGAFHCQHRQLKNLTLLSPFDGDGVL